MIALGFLVFLYCTYTHTKRKKIISDERFLNTVFIGLTAGIIGGRLLFALTQWQDFANNWIEIFYPWIGGFVIAGSIIGVLLTVPIYLKIYTIPILPFLDICGLYAPLMQAISRIGCFLAGCCHGAPTHQLLPWAVTFTDPSGSAPLHIPLHPTQIYISIASLVIFLILRAITLHVKTKPGHLIFLFLALESIMRFSIGFWRGDRGELFAFSFGNFSIELSKFQLVSFVLFIIALASLIIISIVNSKHESI